MRTQTRFGFAGETSTAALPTVPGGRPPPSFVQLSPPSVVFQIPPSVPPERTRQGSRSACQAAA